MAWERKFITGRELAVEVKILGNFLDSSKKKFFFFAAEVGERRTRLADGMGRLVPPRPDEDVRRWMGRHTGRPGRSTTEEELGPHGNKKKKSQVEMRGIDPRASRMLSERSTI